MPKSRPPAARRRNSDNDGEHCRTKRGTTGAMGDRRTDYLQPVIMYHVAPSPQLRLHSSKQTEAKPWTRRRRADYRNHCRIADIAPTIVVATQVWTPHPPLTAIHRPRSPTPSSQDEAPKKEYDTEAPPTFDHRSRFLPERPEWPDPCRRVGRTKHQCLHEGQRRPQPPPSMVMA